MMSAAPDTAIGEKTRIGHTSDPCFRQKTHISVMTNAFCVPVQISHTPHNGFKKEGVANKYNKYK